MSLRVELERDVARIAEPLSYLFAHLMPEVLMPQFVKIGTKADFEKSDAGTLVEAGGQSIAVFNVGGAYYALDNTCTHRGGPLAEGALMGDEVICPWHSATFNVKTGAVTGPPAPQGVKSFPVRVNGEDVEVEIG